MLILSIYGDQNIRLEAGAGFSSRTLILNSSKTYSTSATVAPVPLIVGKPCVTQILAITKFH